MNITSQQVEKTVEDLIARAGGTFAEVQVQGWTLMIGSDLRPTLILKYRYTFDGNREWTLAGPLITAGGSNA